MDLDAACIIVLTETGSSARWVAKYKPSCPVVVVTPQPTTARACNLCRGLYAVEVPEEVTSHEQLVAQGLAYARDRQWLKVGDQVVVVSGMVMGIAGSTNMMQVIDVVD